MPMPEINRRQAMVPAGAVVIENTRGSAPGLWIDHGDRSVVLLPGPAARAEADADRARRRSRCGSARPASRWCGAWCASPAGSNRRSMKCCSRSIASGRQATSAGCGDDPGGARLDRAAPVGTRRVARRRGRGARRRRAVRSSPCSAPTSTAPTVGRSRRSSAICSSSAACTSAWRSRAPAAITSRLTDVPGSSRYVDQSVITYSNDAKTELLGVPPELIAEHGAVSEPVALAMAEGIRVARARRRRRRRHRHRGAERRHAGEAGRHGRRRRRSPAHSAARARSGSTASASR